MSEQVEYPCPMSRDTSRVRPVNHVSSQLGGVASTQLSLRRGTTQSLRLLTTGSVLQIINLIIQLTLLL